MRVFTFFLTAFLACAPLVSGQADGDDPYATKFVRANLHLNARSDVGEIAAVTKNFQRLGDGVAIALLKILDEQQLKDPEVIKRFLPLMRQSFSYPSIISIEINKKPSVTLFLLAYLQRVVSDSRAQQEIKETTEFVKKMTNAAESENKRLSP